MAAPKNRTNFRSREDVPPPNYEDLKFQNGVWYARYSTSNTAPKISPEAARSFMRDNTLTWELGDKIRRAWQGFRTKD